MHCDCFLNREGCMPFKSHAECSQKLQLLEKLVSKTKAYGRCVDNGIWNRKPLIVDTIFAWMYISRARLWFFLKNKILNGTIIAFFSPLSPTHQWHPEWSHFMGIVINQISLSQMLEVKGVLLNSIPCDMDYFKIWQKYPLLTMHAEGEFLLFLWTVVYLWENWI